MVYRYLFLVIQGDLLITQTFNLTVIGAPTLVAGPLGGFALLLNGVDQYFQLPGTDSCLLSPSTCSFGLDFKFNLKIVDFQSDMYILSCGAEEKDTTGVAIWWKRDKLNLRLRTLDKEWKVKARYPSREVVYQDFISVEFSWNVESGLFLYINGEAADSDTKFKKKKKEDAVTPDTCLVGKRRGLAEFFNIIIADLYIVHAPRDLIAEIKVETGQYYTLFLVYTNFQSPCLLFWNCVPHVTKCAGITVFICLVLSRRHLLNHSEFCNQTWYGCASS